MPFCIPAFGHLRRFFSFVGLYQSWQGFFVDRDILLPAHILTGQQQIRHQVDDIPAGEVCSGLLSKGFGKAAHQVLENIAAVHGADLIRSQIALGRCKFLDHKIERVALHQTTNDIVKIKLGKDILNIGGKAIQIIPEVALDVFRVSKQPVKSKPTCVVELIPGRRAKKAIGNGQLLHFLPGIQHFLMCGQQAVMKALYNGHQQNHETVFMRLERHSQQICDIPDHPRFFLNVYSDGGKSIICRF